jgi:hypothetical protein
MPIIGPIARRHIEVLEKACLEFLTIEWRNEMRKGVFISGLIAVTIIAASLATLASACHHRHYGAGYGNYGGGYGYRHLTYYAGGYGYRRYGWYGRRHWRAWG